MRKDLSAYTTPPMATANEPVNFLDVVGKRYLLS